MHPIERLRAVARASGAPADRVAHEAAASLAGFADDPASLVTACRRLVERHPANGPIWWLCARTLVAAEPANEPWRCLDLLVADRTERELAHLLPEGATVAVVGWPERLESTLGPRGDVEVEVIDVEGDGPGFVRELERSGVVARDVGVAGLAATVAAADLLLVDLRAAGAARAFVAPGSWAAAAVARAAGVAVWGVAGVGRVLPARLWSAVERRVDEAEGRAWSPDLEAMPTALLDRVATERGLEPVAEALARSDAPDAPELAR